MFTAGISYDGFGSLALAPQGLLVAGCASLIVLATLGALLAPGVRGLRATR